MPVEDLSLVLVEPTLPENVGAVARVMNNFALRDLRVVSRRDFTADPGAVRVATGARRLLEGLARYDTLEEAVAPFPLVVGATARFRDHRSPPVDLPRIHPHLAEVRSAALVFGTESSGLSNRDLSHCGLLVRIPAPGDHASFNLAQAAGIVLYEMSRGEAFSGKESRRTLASSSEMQGMKAHLFEVLEGTGFLKEPRRETLWQSFSDLAFRARMGPKDVRLVRALLRSVQWALRSSRGPSGTGTGASAPGGARASGPGSRGSGRR